jgi:hypothetical protein
VEPYDRLRPLGVDVARGCDNDLRVHCGTIKHERTLLAAADQAQLDPAVRARASRGAECTRREEIWPGESRGTHAGGYREESAAT